jgi:hypothetical protein
MPQGVIIVSMKYTTKRLFCEIEALMKTDEAYITVNTHGGYFVVEESTLDLKNNYKQDFLVSTNEDMVSEEPKVLIYINEYFYHFFIDSLAVLLKLFRQHPSFHFVVYLQKCNPGDTYDKFLVLLFKILNSLGVRYTAISIMEKGKWAPVYKFKNYILIENLDISQSFPDIEYAADMAIRCSVPDGLDLEAVTVEPYRKVYLTRGDAGRYIGSLPDDYEYYKDDIRMENEFKLMEFLANLGYEVINPETKFDSIMEQIMYMREVKSLVSVTSSGLANSIFMQPNQLVVELKAELVQFRGVGEDLPDQHLHNFYPPLSFMRGHKHLSISSNRDPDKVISDLTSGAFSYIL